MPSSKTFASTGSILLEPVRSKLILRQSPKENQISDVRTPVTDGTAEFVVPKHLNANIDTSVKSAEARIELMNAGNPLRSQLEELEPRAKHPHYTCGLLWDDGMMF